jgi:hypothetical protein
VKHAGWFRKTAAVAAGDFNSNVQWDASRPGRNHTGGSPSIGNSRSGQCVPQSPWGEAGSGNAPNYFYRHEDRPFRIDYVFPRRVGGRDRLKLGRSKSGDISATMFRW